jgi:hypothetical protein
MAHAANKKLSRTKRAKKAPTPRERVVAFIGQLDEMAADQGDLNDAEKAELLEHRDHLRRAVAALLDILDDYEIVRMYTAGSDKPFDPSGPMLLIEALYSAFALGGRVLQNPILERMRQEARKANTAPATQARSSTSELTIRFIRELREPILKKTPRLHDAFVAEKILNPLNTKLNEVLKPKKVIQRKLDTIRRIIRDLRISERSSD